MRGIITSKQNNFLPPRGTHISSIKARGFCIPLGTICTKAGNGRGYAIASCMAENDSCWSNLHKNLLAPYQGFGNGPSQLIQKWIDEEAVSIIEKIESSPETYPFINKYRYWPGPNSNTFAQWIVQGKAILCSRGIGRNFPAPKKYQAQTK